MIEKSFIKLLLEGGRNLKSLRVSDVPIEEIPVYPHNTPLQVIVRALLDYYSVLIEKEGKIEEIITRADFLKIFIK
ncbi:MAG: hypothetical protein QXE05_03125 [Nitrososphaeria archaeon]